MCFFLPLYKRQHDNGTESYILIYSLLNPIKSVILEKNACSIEVDRKYDLTSGRKVTPARKDELKVKLKKEITNN